MGRRFLTLSNRRVRAIAIAAGVIFAVTGCELFLGIEKTVAGDDDHDSGAGGQGSATQGGSAGIGGMSGGDESGGAGLGGTSGGAGGARDGRGGTGSSTGGTQGGAHGGGDDAGGAGAEPGGDSGDDPLVIRTSSVPDAWFKMDYRFQLQGSGGVSGRNIWRIDRGALPNGVDLDETGTLSGAATETGQFGFDIVLAAPGGASTRGQFVMNVIRKRWLVYESDEEQLGKHAIYAVDVALAVDSPAGGVQEKWQITDEPYEYETQTPYAFSPDGRWLAYLDGRIDAERALYVREMTRNEPGLPARVDVFENEDAQSSVREFDWSPDSRFVAFTTSLDGQEPNVYFSDVSAGPPFRGRAVVDASSNYYRVDWVSDDLFTYSGDGSVITAVRVEDDFRRGQSFHFRGEVVQHFPSARMAVFEVPNDGCNGERHLVEFDNSDPREPFNGPIQVSANRTFVAYWDATMGYRIQRLDDGVEVVTIPAGASYCAPGAWSHDERLFATVGGNEDRLYVAFPTSASSTPSLVPGTHPSVGLGTYVRPLFSDDDSWLAFGSGLSVFLSRVGTSSLEPSVAVNDETSSDGSVAFSFAPSSAVLGAGTSPNSSGTGAAFVVDLRSDSPGESVHLGPSADGSRVAEPIAWSKDSTRMAYRFQPWGWPAPLRLYVVDPESALAFTGGVPQATELSAPEMGCLEGRCQFVGSFAFQP